jgi:hypothetical protein
MLVKCNGNCEHPDCSHRQAHEQEVCYHPYNCGYVGKYVECKPVSAEIPPKTIEDDVSGVEVTNQRYLDWQAGYDYKANELKDLATGLNELAKNIDSEIQSIREKKKELTNGRSTRG